MKTDENEKPIPAGYGDNYDVQAIVDEALKKIGDLQEPVGILREYRDCFLRGRSLDVQQANNTLEGETSPIFVSRSSIWEDFRTEILGVENLRFPLEAIFYGEESEDLGGPRKELLHKCYKEMKSELLEEDDGNIAIKYDVRMIANHSYYAAGLLIGCCLLEGGPLPDRILLMAEGEGEHVSQLRDGLKRMGIEQLLKNKPSVSYLTETSSKRLVANRLLQLLKPEFSAEEGSNRRQSEDRMYRLFIRYVREVAAGRRGVIILEDILKFGTGSETEPILGFTMSPSINFQQLPGHIPMASTCINNINLPIVEGESENFIFERFDLAFTNDYFGRR